MSYSGYQTKFHKLSYNNKGLLTVACSADDEEWTWTEQDPRHVCDEKEL